MGFALNLICLRHEKDEVLLFQNKIKNVVQRHNKQEMSIHTKNMMNIYCVKYLIYIKLRD